jgi:tetratricopeptide (TPR) repeat protein
VGQDKTTSILKCVEYSHSNLSESAQQLLLCLAPFSSFIYRGGIPLYAEELKKLEPFKDYDFAGFDDAIQEAINWGLLSPIDDSNDILLSIQPVFPYFLQIRLNESAKEIQSGLRSGFKNYYHGLVDAYQNSMRSRDPREKRLATFFCRLEYENLYNALQISLEKQESLNIYFCLDKYFRVICDFQSMLKIAEEVTQALDKYSIEIIQKEFEEETMIVQDNLANAYIETRQFDKAKEKYDEKLKSLKNLQSIESRKQELSIARTYNQLGIIAHKLRKWDEASYNYLQSLEIKVELGERYEQASTYHNLGFVAKELKQWENARYNYLQANAIWIEFEDRYEQAATYHNLGIVEEQLGDWNSAQNNYYQSIAIYTEFGDKLSQAAVYHSLGIVFQKLSAWDEARLNHLKSLEIKVEFGDKYSQAVTYHSLGIIAEELKRFDEAYENYEQALKIYAEFDDKYSQAVIYNQYGLLAVAEAHLEKATKKLLQALQIFSELEDKHGIVVVTKNIGRIYQSNKCPELLTAIAEIFGVSELEVQQIFDSMNQGT